MANFFLEIFNTAIMAGWLVLAVLVARFLLKKAPAWTKCALWAVVALRLVWPFELESILSLVPSAQTLPPAALTAPAPEIHTGVNVLNSTINPTFTQTFAPEPTASVNPLQVVVAVASVIWLVGVVAMAAYAVFSYLRLRRRVAVSLPAGEWVYLCDHISSPFILGLFRPKIYLPSDLPQEQWKDILSHERAHLARRDHWWKPLGFALLTVFWFHPLLWLAYILLCRDVELACDEKVIRTLSPEEKQGYSETLLQGSMPRKWITACPLAFGETGVKTRIKAVLHYKKPTLWIIIAALLIGSVLAVCFLTEPKNEPDEPWIATAEAISDKQYVYTKPGAGSEFYINIYSDGTFQYYAGVYSSHIGLGDWELKDSKLYLYDTTLTNPMTFVFSVTENGLAYIAAESHPFMYVDVENGDIFRCYTDISLPDRPGMAATCLFDRDIPDTALQGEVALEDFQGISVRWDLHPKYITSEEKPMLVRSGVESTLFGDYPPPLSLYLADVTGDGKMDLCADVYYFFSGLPSFNAVCVYDVANDHYYLLADRSVGSHITQVSYCLRLEEGRLLCDKVWALSASYDVLDTGMLYIAENGELQMKIQQSQTGTSATISRSDLAGKGLVCYYARDTQSSYIDVFSLSLSEDGSCWFHTSMVSSQIISATWYLAGDELRICRSFDDQLTEVAVFKLGADGAFYLQYPCYGLPEGAKLEVRQTTAPEQKQLVWLKVETVKGRHMLALDSDSNRWHILLPNDEDWLDYAGQQCWVKFYGTPEKLTDASYSGYSVQYEVTAISCWSHIEDESIREGKELLLVYDYCRYDYDNDGVLEECIISMGFTSGLSTIHFSTWENGECENGTLILTDHARGYAFVMDENGLTILSSEGDRYYPGLYSNSFRP